jgi:hypothetical protein
MVLISRRVKLYFGDPTLIAKLFFSIYNILSILVLNLFLEKEQSGAFLYLMGQIITVTTISRLGSDFYWSSSEVSKKLRFSKNEVKTHFAIIVLSVISFVLFSEDANISNCFAYLFTFFSCSIMQLMGRHFQKHEKHIRSLFLFTVGPLGICVPLLLVFDSLSYIVVIAISNAFICAPFVKHFVSNFGTSVEDKSFFVRLNYLPMIGFGVLNQNLIIMLSGVYSRQAEIAMLVLFQRMSGLISWPLVIFMQKSLPSLALGIKTVKDFNLVVKDYVLRSLPVIIIFTLISITASCIFLYSQAQISVIHISSMLLISLGCVLNALFAYMQYQMSLKGLSLKLSAIIVGSMIASMGLVNSIDVGYVGSASAFFVFHLLVHSSSAYFLIQIIYKDQKCVKRNA